jgi:mannose-6-phosphate isomerase-like protein (cupin superfamily)
MQTDLLTETAVDFDGVQKKIELTFNGNCKPQIVDFSQIEGVPCPCGTARRGLVNDPMFPGTLHRTDINQTAKAHYHKKLTEIYFVITCEDGAQMLLNDELIPLHNEMAIVIPPGNVHCLIGKAKTFITALPKFDPQDEWIV